MALLADDLLRSVIREALEPESKQRMVDRFLRERNFHDSGTRLQDAMQLLQAFREGVDGHPPNA